MSVKIQVKRTTKQAWIDVNPLLDAGEFGYETDTGNFKIGNGTSLWNALGYAAYDASLLEERFAEEAWHRPARLATAAVLPNTPAYTAGSADADGGTGTGAYLQASENARLVVDSVNAVTGNRILVKDQVNTIHDGVYDVTAQGSASAPWRLTRSADMNGSRVGQATQGEVVGVLEGTTNYNQQFSISSVGTGADGAHLIGSDSLTFQQITGTASFNAGAGLTVFGNTLNVSSAASSRIFVTENAIDLAPITQGDNSAAATNTFVSAITRDGYGRVLGVTTNDVTLTLGTHTTGNYVAELTAGTGVTVTNSGGENSNPTVAIGQAVGTTSNVTFATVTASLTGNASTATTLQTPRNIAGQSFDGSANISIAPTDLTGVTSSASELNILDGATLSTTELNYVDGVTSAIQTQLDNKASATASPVITLGGDLSGSATLTNLGNATLTATIAANSVALGTDTTGDYVASLVAGTGVTLTNNSGEGATPTIAIGQAVGTGASVGFAQVTTTGNVTVGGDIYVNGTYFTTTETSLAIEDPFIYLNDGSTVTNPDLGIAGNYNDGTYRHAGVFRDATDGKWKFFDSYTPEPNNPIDTGHGTYAPATVVAKSIESTVSTGTAPLVVASTTAVTNLNADLLDGQHGSFYAPINNASFTGTFSAPSGTITSTMIADGTIVNDDVSATAAIDLGKLADVSTNAQTASYTLVLADKNKVVEMGVGSANNLTVPLNSSQAFPVGSQINILQTGSGQTTIVATGGVTINATPGLKMRAQWSYATLIKRATDTWVLVGDISA